MIVQMYMTNKPNLALLVVLGSLASNTSIPNIDAAELVNDSRMLMVLDPLGYLWNIHNMTDIKMHSIIRPSQSFQWKGARKVVQENCSNLLPKLEKRKFAYNSFFGAFSNLRYQRFIANPRFSVDIGQRKSTASVLLQHMFKVAVIISASPFLRFEIIPFHTPVSLFREPHAPSKRLNCRMLKFRLSENNLKISWNSPWTNSVT